MVSTGIVGGGIVGVALARALARRGEEVTVLKECGSRSTRPATTPAWSTRAVLQARLAEGDTVRGRAGCRSGSTAKRRGCRTARSANSSWPSMRRSWRRSPRSSAGRSRTAVPDLARIEDGRALREVEPHVAGVAAVHSPHTAVVDYAAITEAMAQDVRAAGGRSGSGTRSPASGSRTAGVRVTTAVSEEVFERVIVCAGLQSDVVARFVGADPSPKILPFRGEYWELAPSAPTWSRA